ncbi:MAG: 3-phosphoshikimate 1-carboxyvinyltransferase [Gemmataceae bacterium]
MADPDTAVVAVEPLARPPCGSVAVPGSKSITNRALILAALSARTRPCRIVRAVACEDSALMVRALEALGFVVRADWNTGAITVGPTVSERPIPATSADLFTGNSGTTMRFLTAVVSLGHGTYRLDGVPRMRQRPIGDLLAALHQAGVEAFSEGDNGCPPVVVRTRGLQTSSIRLRGQASSQFASGLLLAAPWAGRPITIEIVPPLVSRPYVDMTLAMLRAWGVRVHTDDRADRLDIQVMPFCGEAPSQYVVEPDATAASYFFAAAAITGGQITVPGLSYASLQGDVRFVRVLERMGCQVQSTDAGITVRGGPLHGIEVDMQDISDTVMTLAVVALFARGPTAIRNVAHIRHKESDRLHALATELSRLGARVTELSDGLVIYPGPLRPGRVETYQDHRLAMSLALVGLKVPGVHIADPGCVAKTYPDFWRDLATLRL